MFKKALKEAKLTLNPYDNKSKTFLLKFKQICFKIFNHEEYLDNQEYRFMSKLTNVHRSNIDTDWKSYCCFVTNVPWVKVYSLRKS